MNYTAGTILKSGEIYLGRIDDEIILLAAGDERGLFTFEKAMQHIASGSGELPSRMTAIMMWERRDQLKSTFIDGGKYWALGRHDPRGAYFEWGDIGFHMFFFNTTEASVRLTRRLSIESFHRFILGFEE